MTKKEILAKYNEMSEHTLMRTLEIEYTDVDTELGMLEATMPVNPRVHQPMGLLHGGANAALAESLGSAASVLFIDAEKFAVLGIELSCNHIRSKREGLVTGTATIIHKGRSTHLWEIKICDEEGKLLSHCKLTNMIVPLRKTN
jgi:1,4-dihydroxy-2-naphthoyl-CoA hydrolase